MLMADAILFVARRFTAGGATRCYSTQLRDLRI
jgi:hypothetical protein